MTLNLISNSDAIPPELRNRTEAAIENYGPYRKGMKYYVGEFIYQRLQDVLNNPDLLCSKRILTSDVFYYLRPILEANNIDVTSTDAIIVKKRRVKIQNEYILQVCRDIGIKRRDVGIITGDAGYLYFRGQRHAVSLDDLDELKHLGTDIIIIEKQGIAEKLRYKAANMMNIRAS